MSKFQVFEMSARHSHWLDFKYSDPEKNFDRSQVHGPAATLFKVKDKKFCVALDTAGGGKVRACFKHYREAVFITHSRPESTSCVC